MLAVALVGYGRWARHIHRDLQTCGAEVHVVTPLAPDRAAALASGAVSAHDNVANLPLVHGAIIASPSTTHAAVVEAFAVRDIPLFVEKPLTSDVESARSLCERHAPRVFVMHKWRYHPAIEWIRAEIASGKLGEVLAIRTERTGWGHTHADVKAWWILLPHDLSILQHCLGRVPPLREVHRCVPGSIDAGFLVELGAGTDPRVLIDVSTTRPRTVRRVSVLGSHGAVEYQEEGAQSTLAVRRGTPGTLDAKEERVSVTGEMPLLLEIREFVAYLEGGAPPRCGAHEGLEVVERIAEIEAALLRLPA